MPGRISIPAVVGRTWEGFESNCKCTEDNGRRYINLTQYVRMYGRTHISRRAPRRVPEVCSPYRSGPSLVPSSHRNSLDLLELGNDTSHILLKRCLTEQFHNSSLSPKPLRAFPQMREI